MAVPARPLPLSNAVFVGPELLIGSVLFVQLLTFIRSTLSFLIFAVVGCPLVAAGILLSRLLYSWISS